MVFLQEFENLATWPVFLIEIECTAWGKDREQRILQILSFCASCCEVLYHIFWDYMYARFFEKKEMAMFAYIQSLHE